MPLRGSAAQHAQAQAQVEQHVVERVLQLVVVHELVQLWRRGVVTTQGGIAGIGLGHLLGREQ